MVLQLADMDDPTTIYLGACLTGPVQRPAPAAHTPRSPINPAAHATDPKGWPIWSSTDPKEWPKGSNAARKDGQTGLVRMALAPL
eukprot:7202813-Prymnesium_polylepis.1